MSGHARGKPITTPNPSERLADRRRQRLAYMHRLYELTDGDRMQTVASERLAGDLGISAAEESHLAIYLQDEGLIDFSGGGQVSITHQGVLEVEDAIEAPERPTQHFAPFNVIYANTISNSQIQQGTTGSTITASVSGDDVAALQSLVADLHRALDDLPLGDADRDEARSELVTVEAQLASPRPKRAIIRESLRTVRSLAEGVASNAIAAGLLPALAEALHRLQ